MFEEALSEQFLTEAINTEYPVFKTMSDKWKERTRYFYGFGVDGVPYVVKFINQWYGKGKIGPNSYIMSIHSVKSSGLLHKKVMKIKNPQRFISGVVSTVMRFQSDIKPHAIIMRVHYKDARNGKLAERVIKRVPQLKKGMNVWAFVNEKMMLSFLIKKSAPISTALKAIVKDLDPDQKGFISKSDLEEVILKPAQEKMAADDPADDGRVYRVDVNDVYGVRPSNTRAELFMKDNPPPKVTSRESPKVESIEEYPELLRELSQEKIDDLNSGDVRKRLSVSLTTPLEDPPPATQEEINTLGFYTGSGYHQMRMLFTAKEPNVSSVTEGYIQQLDSLFSKKAHTLPDNLELYRGMSVVAYGNADVDNVEYNLIENYANREYIRLQAYTSFSLAPNVALSFTASESNSKKIFKSEDVELYGPDELSIPNTPHTYQYNFIIRAKGGSNVNVIIPGEYSSYESELEVIVPRGTFMKVVDRKRLTVDERSFIIFLDVEFVKSEDIILESEEKRYDIMAEGKKERREDKKNEKIVNVINALNKAEKPSEKDQERLKNKYGSPI